MAIKFGPATQLGIVQGLLAILHRKQAVLDMERELRRKYGVRPGPDNKYTTGDRAVDEQLGLIDPGEVGIEEEPGAPGEAVATGRMGEVPVYGPDTTRNPFSLDYEFAPGYTRKPGMTNTPSAAPSWAGPSWAGPQTMDYGDASTSLTGDTQKRAMPAGYTPPTYGLSTGGYSPPSLTGSMGDPYSLSLGGEQPAKDPYSLSLGVPGKEMSAYDRYKLKMGGLRSR